MFGVAEAHTLNFLVGGRFRAMFQLRRPLSKLDIGEVTKCSHLVQVVVELGDGQWCPRRTLRATLRHGFHDSSGTVEISLFPHPFEFLLSTCSRNCCISPSLKKLFQQTNLIIRLFLLLCHLFLTLSLLLYHLPPLPLYMYSVRHSNGRLMNCIVIPKALHCGLLSFLPTCAKPIHHAGWNGDAQLIPPAVISIAPGGLQGVMVFV